MPQKKLFQPLRHANFLGYVFTKCIIKHCQTFKARQTKSVCAGVCAGTMKPGQNLCQTHNNTQKKLQVAAIFNDIAIRILVVQSEKVCFVESCLGRELKGIASFPASTSSPRHYSIRRNYQQDCIFFREQWWLIGSDTRLKTAVLGSNPAISPAYSGLPVLRWAAIWDGT